MSPIVKKERNYNIDLLRIISAFAIVVLHVAAKNIYNVNIMSNRWLAFNIYELAVRWAVPVFVMISGVFFLDVSKELSLKKLYAKNALRLVTAYVFWSAVYALEHLFMYNYDAKKYFLDFIGGENFLWFLVLMVSLYLYTPFLRKITADRSSEKHFLLVFGILFILIPTILSFVSPEMFKKVNFLFYERHQISLFCGMVGVYYSFYFVLGHYLHNTKISKEYKHILFLIAAVALVVSVVATVNISRARGGYILHFYRFLSVTVAIESAAVFVLFDNVRLKLKDKTKKIITTLSACSFGVYLVHMLFVEGLDFLGYKTTDFNSFISVPAYSVAIFLAALLVSYILNKIPYLNKYIV